MFRKVAFSVLTIGWLWTGEASATASMSCSGIDCDAGLEMVFGAGPVPNILDMGVSVGDRVISTRPGEGIEEGVIGQAYFDGELTRIEMMDDQVTTKLVTIRILHVRDLEEDDFQIGYIQIENDHPVAVKCDGP